MPPSLIPFGRYVKQAASLEARDRSDYPAAPLTTKMETANARGDWQRDLSQHCLKTHSAFIVLGVC